MKRMRSASFVDRFDELRRREKVVHQWLYDRQNRPNMCRHPRARAVRQMQPNGHGGMRAVARTQCVVCGRLGRAVSQATVRPVALLREADTALPLRRMGYVWDYGALKRAVEAKYSAQWWKTYDDYLHSDGWKLKRAAVLKRASGLCEGCGESRATQVHHMSYSNVGKELLFDLRALCIECHAHVHRSVSGGENNG